ncbi:MAG: L-Ala-D/L-Glu epimerase [Solirubrobacteraceae bacterium]|jgi:o-succinylbenzoate synthase|nr:L-Ala-D/L-Glu epimerase [Solirubrobacteraceae bacterium]
MRAPVVSSHGSVSVRPLILVSLTGEDGVTGYGEAAPLESYDGVGTEDVLAALEDCRDVLSAAAPETPRAALLAACARAAVLPQAIAAVDLALWDLEGRRSGKAVWQLLGASSPSAIEVNASVAVADRSGAAAAAAEARDAGFRAIKVKVGLADDAGRLAAVRAFAGPAMAIRIDANGAWSVPEAVAALRGLGPVGIELCEEPAAGVEAVAEVAAQVPVPVALDESVRQPGALATRVCDAVCLKISGCGGISGVIETARQARAVGYEVYLASTYDGPLGIAAALHAAAALTPDRTCGLATLGMFEGRGNMLAPLFGRITVPVGPGLGEGLVDWYDAGAG